MLIDFQNLLQFELTILNNEMAREEIKIWLRKSTSYLENLGSSIIPKLCCQVLDYDSFRSIPR